MADLLNARWLEMMEKMQTEKVQGREEIYLFSGIEPTTLCCAI
jgi:hypothetical protein